jgi:F-type H+-transporting ATPase subunit delta
MLKSPLIQNDKKRSIVRAVLAGKTDALINEAFDLIIRKNRANVLTVIGDEFVKMYQRLNDILEVKIISATPLSEASRSQLLAHVEQLIQARYQHNGKQPVITLEEKTDSELIGGFVLKIGDLQYDGSFAETLRRLRQEFQSNPYIKN